MDNSNAWESPGKQPVGSSDDSKSANVCEKGSKRSDLSWSNQECDKMSDLNVKRKKKNKLVSGAGSVAELVDEQPHQGNPPCLNKGSLTLLDRWIVESGSKMISVSSSSSAIQQQPTWWSAIPFGLNSVGHSPAKFVSLVKFVMNIKKWKARARARTRLDRRWMLTEDKMGIPPRGRGSHSEELMFSKVLTLSDVSSMPLLVLMDPTKNNFPELSMGESVRLRLRDSLGERRIFRLFYSIDTHTCFFSDGWLDFVKAEMLMAGDTLSLYRVVGAECSNTFFMSCIRKPVVDALLYCTLFPLDLEFEKDKLAKLWMAIGVFAEEPIERHALLFFQDCVTLGFFQFCRTNVVTLKPMYKFIGAPIPISRDTHFVRIEGNFNLHDVSPEVSHLSIMSRNLKDSTAISGLERFKQLSTLIFLQGHELRFNQVTRNLFISLSQLLVLDVSNTHLIELPSSFGKMKCLRFLDLSGTPIKRLPEAIDCFKNLQTLNLRGCSNLSILPKGMRKLVNLRHLDFDVFRQLRSMPDRMGELTNIRTLSAFLVGVEEGCSIRQLKNMVNLSGTFCISGLENVLTKDEAEEACLHQKSQLKKLELHWSDSQQVENVFQTFRHGEIISSLQPNASLEELHINCYGGFELPSWICNQAFCKLVSITLFEFEHCLALPSFGQLPSLKNLNLVGFHKLRVIGHNIYGGLIENIAFPMLENLTVESMSSLEHWSGIRNFDFPRLLNLTVRHCPRLHSLCTLSSICSLKNLEISHCEVLAFYPDGMLPSRVETLIIEDCPLINAQLLNEGGQDWPKVAHIPHVWIDHQEISFGQKPSQRDED